MKLSLNAITTLSLLLLTLSSCKILTPAETAKNDPRGTTVANYKGGKVTLREAQIELNKLILKNKKLKGLTFANLSSDQKESLIKEIVLKKSAYKEAKKRNLDDGLYYKDALNLFETELLKQQLYADISKQASQPENVKKNYDKLAVDLENKKDIRIRYIAVKTEDSAKAIAKVLAKSPKSFAKQAKLKSIDKEIAKKGGDLGYILEDFLPVEIAKIANSLEKGKISNPIFLGDKWVIIKLEDHRAAEISKYEDIKENLAKNLAKKALQDFISQSIADANITVSIK